MTKGMTAFAKNRQNRIIKSLLIGALLSACGSETNDNEPGSSTTSSSLSQSVSTTSSSSQISSVASSSNSLPSIPGLVLYDVAPYNVTGSSGCTNTFTCADFEQGLSPANGNATRDTSLGYKSNASFKVSSNQSTFLQMDIPSSDFWVRAFVRGSGSQQAPNQGFALAHGVFIRAMDNGKQLRVGDHRCQLELNRDGGGWDDLEMTSGSYGGDNICNETVGARMQPNTWYCLEVHYSGPGSEVQVFWDNQNVEQLHVKADRIATNADKKPENGYDNQWGDATVPWGPNNFSHVEFGYQSFNNGGAPNATFWFDNIATASHRIGCGDDYEIKEALDSSTRYPGYQQEENLPAPTVIQ